MNWYAGLPVGVQVEVALLNTNHPRDQGCELWGRNVARTHGRLICFVSPELHLLASARETRIIETTAFRGDCP